MTFKDIYKFPLVMEEFDSSVEDNFQYHDSAWFGRDNDEQYSIKKIIKLWKQKSI